MFAYCVSSFYLKKKIKRKRESFSLARDDNQKGPLCRMQQEYFLCYYFVHSQINNGLDGGNMSCLNVYCLVSCQIYVWVNEVDVIYHHQSIGLENRVLNSTPLPHFFRLSIWDCS
ncbi:hypothetical protein QVD17_07846 [Tagetes erecta]|uniref:Uncharacterized protein n=1 Tax=Tagetes erecta TaxID=13708 RepID=A0AAD8P400_TARER|nr:hypothetical protein QVD17_07846 [Tagetes erecta]